MSEPTVLKSHPEVAQLYTLQYAARVALRMLAGSRSTPAVERLRNAVTEVVAAVDEYRSQIDRIAETRRSVSVPKTWSRHQGAAMADFLTAMANAVRTETDGYG